MKLGRVGTRGTFFTFETPFKTNVFVVNGGNHVFLCDTFLGTDPMEEIKRYLEENELASKPLVVFISHADFDHYWGNGGFKSSMILGHELCRKRIERESSEALTSFKEFKQGTVEIVPPNTVFSERIFFAEDGVEFYHTPGHTLDSASCFDHVDKVLFVGDNVESPIPHVNEPNFTEYTATLEEYLKRDAKTILTGHDDILLDKALIRSNMNYVRNLQTLNVEIESFDKKAKIVHFMNLITVGEKLKDQKKPRDALGFYEESRNVLEQLDDSTEGKQEQMKKVTEIIKLLSDQLG